MMDCDTTGVEPDIALVKYKRLVGGGMIKIVNNTVPLALKRLGYDRDQVREIVEYIDEHDTIEGAPHLKDEHLPVFDCAFKPAKGSRSIHYRGHLKMLGAVQPFISGAISKTINMPEDSTAEDILQAYVEGWQLGLKAVADLPRQLQAQPAALDQARRGQGARSRRVPADEARAVRRKLSDERRALTHKFSVGDHEGYITVGVYDDGQPGEIFLTMAKEGSTISGLMDAFATAISIALQYGVPLKTLVDKFSHTRFEPSGFTKNPEIPIAKSVTDYIFRWLASRFLSNGREAAGRGDPARRAARRCPRRQEAASTRGRRNAAGRRLEPRPPQRRQGRGRGRADQGHVPLPAGRAELPRVRRDHGAERRLLQVPELRLDERLLVGLSVRVGGVTAERRGAVAPPALRFSGPSAYPWRP